MYLLDLTVLCVLEIKFMVFDNKLDSLNRQNMSS